MLNMKVVHKRDKQELKHRVYIGRPSIYGNPFKMTEAVPREKAIHGHKLWLWHEIKEGRWQHLDRLINLAEDGGVELECFCAPKPCHGDTIIKACNWINENREKL